MIKVGDRVRFTGTHAGSSYDYGQEYTVTSVAFGGASYYLDNRSTHTNKVEFISSPDPVETFKTALKEFRATGYDVQVTVTRTVTEDY